MLYYATRNAEQKTCVEFDPSPVCNFACLSTNLKGRNAITSQKYTNLSFFLSSLPLLSSFPFPVVTPWSHLRVCGSQPGSVHCEVTVGLWWVVTSVLKRYRRRRTNTPASLNADVAPNSACDSTSSLPCCVYCFPLYSPCTTKMIRIHQLCSLQLQVTRRPKLRGVRQPSLNYLGVQISTIAAQLLRIELIYVVLLFLDVIIKCGALECSVSRCFERQLSLVFWLVESCF